MQIKITPLDRAPDEAIAAVEHLPGLLSAYVMRPMDMRPPLVVTAWEGTDAADLAPVSPDGHYFVGGSFLEAETVGEAAAYGLFVHFDGPRPAAEADAICRANRERLAPAVRHVRGNLGAFLGRNPDGSCVVVALTTSLQAIEDCQRAVRSAELLPGEDPALLTVPDRIHLAWVLAASVRPSVFAF